MKSSYFLKLPLFFAKPNLEGQPQCKQAIPPPQNGKNGPSSFIRDGGGKEEDDVSRRFQGYLRSEVHNWCAMLRPYCNAGVSSKRVR